MTDGHELRWVIAGGKGSTGERGRGEKLGTIVIAQSIKYTFKKDARDNEHSSWLFVQHADSEKKAKNCQ